MKITGEFESSLVIERVETESTRTGAVNVNVKVAGDGFAGCCESV